MKGIPTWAHAALVFILSASLGLNAFYLVRERSTVLKKLDEISSHNDVQYNIITEFARLLCHSYDDRIDEARKLFYKLQDRSFDIPKKGAKK